VGIKVFSTSWPTVLFALLISLVIRLLCKSYFLAAKSFRGGYQYRFLPEKQEFIGFI
jgi:hypothetical protein